MPSRVRETTVPWKNTNTQVGYHGDQTVWLHDERVDPDRVKLGMLIEVTGDKGMFIYKVKDYVDGWWKLEWPD